MSGGAGGVTHTIREHLGFTDEKRWKEFSTRRLELIDKFNLSSRKASEQDDTIRQIASLLRDEFNFPPDTLSDFDKLVRAAIQSVRRNRKRSSRAKVHHDRFVVYDEMGRAVTIPQPQQNQQVHPLGTQSSGSSNSNSTTNLAAFGMGLGLATGVSNSDASSLGLGAPLSMPTSSAPTPSLFGQHQQQIQNQQHHPVISSSLLSLNLGQPQVLNGLGNTNATPSHSSNPTNNAAGGPVNVHHESPTDARVVINSLLSSNATTTTSSTPSTSIATSPTSTHLPSIKALTSSTHNSIAAATSSSSNSTNKMEISQHTKQKLLNFIQKSKSCLLLSNNDTSIHEDNLNSLGKSVMNASISFILERFFNDISSDSINYLANKLQNVQTLSKILKALGFFSTDVLILTDTQASNLLCKLIGCCIKDFGFDGVSFTLGEIFHEIILNEYPLIATQVAKITPESLFTPMLPIAPKDADSEVTKEVKLVYGSRSLDFKFSPLSAAPPTYLELVENGIVAFGIQGKNIRLRFEGKELVDLDIAKLFRSYDIKKLEIELYEVRSDGVKFTPLL